MPITLYERRNASRKDGLSRRIETDTSLECGDPHFPLLHNKSELNALDSA